MKVMIVSGPRTSRLCSRQNGERLYECIAQFLEGKPPGGHFRCLREIARASGPDWLSLDAVRLRVEVFHAWSGLWRVQRAEQRQGGARQKPQLPLPRGARLFMRTLLVATEGVVAGDVVRVRVVEGNELPLRASDQPDVDEAKAREAERRPEGGACCASS